MLLSGGRCEGYGSLAGKTSDIKIAHHPRHTTHTHTTPTRNTTQHKHKTHIPQTQHTTTQLHTTTHPTHARTKTHTPSHTHTPPHNIHTHTHTHNTEFTVFGGLRFMLLLEALSRSRSVWTCDGHDELGMNSDPRAGVLTQPREVVEGGVQTHVGVTGRTGTTNAHGHWSPRTTTPPIEAKAALPPVPFPVTAKQLRFNVGLTQRLALVLGCRTFVGHQEHQNSNPSTTLKQKHAPKHATQSESGFQNGFWTI